MSASTIPSIRIQCPPPPVSSSSVPSSPDPSLSRSWNYHRTSVGEHLDLVAGVGGLGNDSGDTSGGGGVPITPQRNDVVPNLNNYYHATNSYPTSICIVWTNWVKSCESTRRKCG